MSLSGFAERVTFPCSEIHGFGYSAQEITWNPREGFYLHYDIQNCYDGARPPENHRICQLQNCYTDLANGCFYTCHHTAFAPVICYC